MMTSADLLNYISDQFGVDTDDIEDDTGLLSEGVLDSFSIVDLVVFLESENGISINPSEVNLDNLDSVSKILKFVESKST